MSPMLSGKHDHPGADELRAFALGQVAGSQRARLERHISACSACAEALGEVSDDTLMGKLRGSQTVGPVVLGAVAEGCSSMPVELMDHPRYRILRRLGSGGMGVVFQAVHRLMDREVALKVISDAFLRHPLAVQRFAQEVKAAAKLAHPNIVAAHDAEQVGDVHFLVMEYVEGVSLERFAQKNGPLPVTVACHFARQAALGLQHAHEQGMVHRDIKPANLMVTRKGVVKILDFGLARLAEEAAKTLPGERPLTTLGTMLGTPDFIAPEQVGDSHGVDIRADIYSLGCTLYFLLSGQLPFPDGSAMDKARLHVEAMPAPLRAARPDIPAELEAVLGRMMAKKPADRYATPGEAAQALSAFVRPATKPSPPKPPPVPAATRPARRIPWPWLAGAAAGVVVVGTLIGFVLAGMGKFRPGGVPPLAFTAPLPRILVVAPSRGRLPFDCQRLMDALPPDKAEVVVASASRGPFDGKKGDWPEGTLALGQARADDYAAVVFTGGPGLDQAFLPVSRADCKVFCLRMLAQGKPVAGLGGGAAILGKAGLLRGKRATGLLAVHSTLNEGGAAIMDEELVVEGCVMTARDASAAGRLAEALLERIGRK